MANVPGDYVSVLSHGLLVTGTTGTGSATSESYIGNQDTQRWIPWVDAITYTSVRTNSSNTSDNLDNVAVYQLGNGEVSPSYGVFTKYDIKVTFDCDELDYDPKPRDTIAWGSDTYTVLEVDRSKFLDFWAVTARNIVAASDLRSTGVLSRPTSTQDSTGRMALTTYSNVTTGIQCRVQPEASAAGDPFGRRTMPKRYIAFVGQTLDARARDKFTVSAVDYTVLEWRDAERIDMPNTLLLELIS